VTTSPVTHTITLSIFGTYNGVREAGALTLHPPPPPPVISSVTLDPAELVGGYPTTGTVTLSGPAPSGGAVIELESGIAAAADVPPTVTIPAGATSATFPVATSPVSSTTSFSIHARYNGGQPVLGPLTLHPTSWLPVISSVTLNPAAVTGGESTTGTVTLSGAAPPGGATIELEVGVAAAASVPATVTVPAGATSATFPVTTSPVTSTITFSIFATYNGGEPVPGALTLHPPTCTQPVAASLTTYTPPGGSPSQHVQFVAQCGNLAGLDRIRIDTEGTEQQFIGWHAHTPSACTTPSPGPWYYVSCPVKSDRRICLILDVFPTEAEGDQFNLRLERSDGSVIQQTPLIVGPEQPPCPIGS
jgi:hypothetical protein